MKSELRAGISAGVGRAPAHDPERGPVRPAGMLRIGVFAWFIFLFSLPAHASDWPQLACTPQRTGWTPDEPAMPMGLRWVAVIGNERHAERFPIAYWAQPAVCGGRVFGCTRSGNLHAFEMRSGKHLWQYACGEGVMAGAGADRGKVFIGDLGGVLHAVNAETGAQVWRFKAEGAISCSVLLAEDKVFISDRLGNFYAVDMDTGARLWQTDLGAPVMMTAAYDEGRVFIADEFMFGHCLDAAAGGELWKTEKMYGQSFWYQFPVCFKGKVMFRAGPRVERYVQPHQDTALLMYPEMLELDGIIKGDLGAFAGSPLADYSDFIKITKRGLAPAEVALMQDHIIAWFGEHPWHHDTFVFNQADGAQAYVPGVVFTCANSGSSLVSPLPVAAGDGYLYLAHNVFAAGSIGSGGPAGLARMDSDTGRVTEILALRAMETEQKECQYGGWSVGSRVLGPDGKPNGQVFHEITNDEPFPLAMGGNTLFTAHQGAAFLNTATRQVWHAGGWLKDFFDRAAPTLTEGDVRLFSDIPPAYRQAVPDHGWFAVSGDMLFTFSGRCNDQSIGHAAVLVACGTVTP